MAKDSLKRFSTRYGFSASKKNKLIHEDAPESVRCGLLQIVHDEMDKKPKWLRSVICGVLRVREDPDNWSDYPNIWQEVQGMVLSCDWFRVYDIIEGIYKLLVRKKVFEVKINELFVEEGIGWQLVNGEIQVRGDEAFECILADSAEVLDQPGMTTATTELHEAIHDLSRRPKPDLSGAIQHAMAALECVARQVSGDEKPTLGGVIKKHPDLFPPPVDKAVEKLWGYASEQARHGRESRDLAWEEVQLIVGISAVLCSYLVQKEPFEGEP